MGTYAHGANTGTGSGEITPDGCAVEVYARLPEMGESGIIASAVADPQGRTLLELGSGAGRMTRPLTRRGFRVTAVDESQGMLDLVEGAETVRSTIEGLDLGRRFDVVTLTSFLVNTADPAQREGLLATCARHVADDGCVVIQRQQDSRHEDVRPGHGWSGQGMTITTTEVEDVGDGVTRAHVEYTYQDPEAGGGGGHAPKSAWSQTYYTRLLKEPAFAQALLDAGLVLDRWLTDTHDWVRAAPAPH
ncbi:class I SAM-dependent methyltransferase [Streptomyces iconiensis]|uniref:Class I SAM-dependent methyltransferase n=1 Tax=Streptomyces iconiensis TaxID=1384038 RepID=A0ABT6ZTL4_9ACTN|nr:class I SAM-dependent methyltransferase [Streptomyces iconiensis]MDJ1132406.1 class I SAM-dependent methyltransferase [Streptomyces iconiensis]